jgi:adenylate cyclase
MQRGDAERVMAAAAGTLDLARGHDLTQWLRVATCLHGWASYRLGDRERGLAELMRGIARLGEQGWRMYVPWLRSLAAEMTSELGDVATALAEVDAALAQADDTGEHVYDAEIHRIRGAILLRRDPADTAAAEQALQAAIAIAQHQHARSFELRAALALVRLYRPSNRGADARAVLAPVVEGFPPTAENPELASAQALLSALNP